MLVWADIENDPQVQYLVPLLEACAKRGADTLVTARDYGSTYALLSARGVEFDRVGTAYGASKPAKVLGLVKRTRLLESLIRRGESPHVLVSASRAASIAARRLGIRSFVISDYEHANLTLFRWTGATILHPHLIAPTKYLAAGFTSDRLIPFSGLKEDLTFAGLSLDRIEPGLGDWGIRENLVRVLIRPPAEESHYYNRLSRALYLDALRYVAAREEVVIIFSPRYPRQREDLASVVAANPPIVLNQGVPFLSLLRSIDVVLCSGGTMLREAAYLGVPAYSLFASEVGEIDRYLASIGRAVLLSSASDLPQIRLERLQGFSPLSSNPNLIDDIADLLLDLSPKRSEVV